MKSFSIVFASALLLATSGSFAQAPSTTAAGPSDAQIAHIVVTANQVDIDAGKLAETKGHRKAVRDFGKEMVTDHSAVNKQAHALVTRLKLTPEDNPTSQSLKNGGEENLKHLKGLKAAAFDEAYVAHEIAYHEQVIDAIDKLLIPNAKNPDLKALLVKVRPAFVGHLEHAKAIQSSLQK